MPAAIWPRCCRVCGALAGLLKCKRSPGGVRCLCRECYAGYLRMRRRAGDDTPEREARKRYHARYPDRKAASNVKYFHNKRANPDPQQVAVGAAVSAWRQQHGLNQREMAKLLRCGQTAISRREAGIWRWPADDLDKLERAGVVLPGVSSEARI